MMTFVQIIWSLDMLNKVCLINQFIEQNGTGGNFIYHLIESLLKVGLYLLM